MVMNAVASDQLRRILSHDHFGEDIITSVVAIAKGSRSVLRGEYVPAPLIQGGNLPVVGLPRGAERKYLASYL